CDDRGALPCWRAVANPSAEGSAMAFRITTTREAEAQLEALPARERRTVEAAILARLRDQPTTPTRAIKRLRPNPVAQDELRVGAIQVLEPDDDDDLVNRLLESNPSFRALVEKSKASPRRPFPSTPDA